MIKLEAEDYCQDCDAFEPEAETVKVFGEPPTTHIYCRSARKCNRMYHNILKAIERSGNDGIHRS